MHASFWQRTGPCICRSHSPFHQCYLRYWHRSITFRGYAWRLCVCVCVCVCAWGGGGGHPSKGRSTTKAHKQPDLCGSKTWHEAMSPVLMRSHSISGSSQDCSSMMQIFAMLTPASLRVSSSIKPDRVNIESAQLNASITVLE